MANKKRLIDIDALGIGRCNPDLLPFCNRPYAAGWNGVVTIIENAPTVDAVEVVRCKDCVWCHKFEDLNYCENPKAPWIDDPDYDDITVAENDFCSYGERKDNG